MKIEEIKEGYIQNLVIEITRDCNFKCSHCLRGEAQSKDMDFHKLRQFIYANEVGYIGSLTITGGEPLMKSELINLLVSEIICMDLNIDYVYIASNGSYLNYESIRAISKLFNRINEQIHLEISNSVYHQEERTRLGIDEVIFDKDYLQESIRKELMIKEENDDYRVTNKMYDIDYLLSDENFILSLDRRTYNKLISEGRGSAIGGYVIPEKSDDMIYFSSQGEVVIGKCDLSFKSIRKERILKVS